MILELRFDAGRPRRWLQRAIRVLTTDQTVVQVVAVEGAADKPRELDLLFELERLILRRGAQSGADAMAADAIASHSGKGIADVVVDFAARAADKPNAVSGRILTPLYDGVAGEDGILAAVLAGDLPTIEILDNASGEVIASGRPSAENAAGLSGALDTVMARTVTLLAAAIAGGSGGNKLAESRTIDIRNVLQIQKNVLVVIFHHLASGVAQTFIYIQFRSPR